MVRDMTVRAFVEEAMNGRDPEADTKAAREQQEEIKLAHERAAEMETLLKRVDELRELQHRFIVRSRAGAKGWRKLGPVLISEIVKISRQRIGEIVEARAARGDD